MLNILVSFLHEETRFVGADNIFFIRLTDEICKQAFEHRLFSMSLEK